jgi:hypothetical protein
MVALRKQKNNECEETRNRKGEGFALLNNMQICTFLSGVRRPYSLLVAMISPLSFAAPSALC